MIKRTFAMLLLLLSATLSLAVQQSGGWVKFSPPDGRITVLMPSIPGEEKQTSTDPKAGSYTTHMFSAPGNGEFYLVGWVDYDPAFKFNVQSELNANRDNFIRGVKAKLVNSTEIKLGAHQGIEFTAEGEEAVFKSRVYVVGRRPYQLIAMSRKSAGFSQNVDKFLTSFEVKSGK